MVNQSWRIDVSDQQPQPTSAEAATIGSAGPVAPEAPVSIEPVKAAAEVEAPLLSPNQEETSPVADAPKVEAVSKEAPKAELPKAEEPKAEALKAEAPKVEAPKPDASKIDDV